MAALLVFFGCEKHSPVSSIESESSPDLQFIPLGNGNGSFNKIISVSEWVTKKDGGELIIDYKGSEHDNGDVEVKITFKVFSNTISEDAMVTLSLDDQYLMGNVDVDFAPNGITFSEPALLNIEAKKISILLDSIRAH